MKIAVISSPFASHIGRMDFVLQALRERGHDIELWGSGATSGIAKRNGFTFRPLDLQGDYEGTMQRKLRAHEFYTEMFFPMAKEQTPTVLEYCRLYKPDLLETNTRVYSAAIAAKLRNSGRQSQSKQFLVFADPGRPLRLLRQRK